MHRDGLSDCSWKGECDCADCALRLFVGVPSDFPHLACDLHSRCALWRFSVLFSCSFCLRHKTPCLSVAVLVYVWNGLILPSQRLRQ